MSKNKAPNPKLHKEVKVKGNQKVIMENWKNNHTH